MAVSVKNISVSFPGVKALQDVSLEFKDSRIHAVLGANGSGKSTLVKVLTGIYHPDKGCGAQITVDNNTVEDIISPNAAHDIGIRVVHQESPMLNTFTVEECIALFKEYPMKGSSIDWKAVHEYAVRLMETYDIKVDPTILVDDLSAAERNMIAMAMAMGMDQEREQTRVLLLDEADASVPASEAETFLQHVRNIANMGIPVIMVTHRIQEVMDYCDDISILNGGQLIYEGLVSETSEDTIVRKMLRPDAQMDENGELPKTQYTLSQLWDRLKKKQPEKTDAPAMEVKNLHAENLKGLSFQVYPGEILGIIGIPDSGVRQLPEVLAGDSRIYSGEYVVCGRKLPHRLTPKKVYKSGVTVLPADRPVRGGIMSSSLRDNVLLPNEIQFWNRNRLAVETMNMAVDIFDIQPAGKINMEFGKFSGGNQQKAIMAKWLAVCPKVFVLDDPTYGVDPGSRLRIFDNIRKAAEMNVAIVLFSTEPEQLVNICTRIVVLKEGVDSGELKTDDGTLTRENVARCCYV